MYNSKYLVGPPVFFTSYVRSYLSPSPPTLLFSRRPQLQPLNQTTLTELQTPQDAGGDTYKSKETIVLETGLKVITERRGRMAQFAIIDKVGPG